MGNATAAPPTVLTLQEAADVLKVSARTLYSMTSPRGPIPCLRVGPRGVRYTLAAIERFIAAQEAGCCEICSASSGERETTEKTA